MIRSRLAREKNGMMARPAVRCHRGFSLLELCVAMGIAVVMTSIAVPVVRSSLNAYRLNTAVVSVTGAVQTTRYRAIQTGYPFQIVFNRAASTYQILSDPNDVGNFANVGNPVVFSTVPNIINQNTTLTFRPGGAVQSPQALANGTTPMTLTYLNVTPELITVSAYGRTNVIP